MLKSSLLTLLALGNIEAVYAGGNNVSSDETTDMAIALKSPIYFRVEDYMLDLSVPKSRWSSLENDLKSHPEDGNLYLQRSSIDAVRMDDAQEDLDLKKSLALSPNSASVHIGMARMYKVHNDSKSEKAELSKAIALSSGVLRKQALVELAVESRDRTDHEKNLQRWTDVIALATTKKEKAAYYYLRAHTYSHLNQWEKSCNDFKASIKLCPNLINAHLFYGSTLSGLGESQKAVDQLNYVIRLDEKYGVNNIESPPPKLIESAYESRARAYYQLGEKKLADRDKEQVQRIRKSVFDIMPFSSK